MNEPGKNSLVTPSSQHPQPIGVSQETKKQVKVSDFEDCCEGKTPKDPIWSLGFACSMRCLKKKKTSFLPYIVVTKL